jgi:hypothetical protein
MGLFDWIRPNPAPIPVSAARATGSATRRKQGHQTPAARPNWWRQTLPLNGVLYGDDSAWSLLEEMRRSVPLVDRSVSVLAQLVGEICVEAEPAVKKELSAWMETVKVNQAQQGLTSWIRGQMESMLLYGKGAGELVPTRDLRDVYALTNLDPRSVLFKVTDDPLVLQAVQRTAFLSELRPLPPETTLISLHGAQTDRPHGVSIFRSCPFVIKAMRTIENATAQLWERVGCPPFHINVELDPAMDDPEGEIATEVLGTLKTEWDAVMGTARDPESGTVADYFSAGKVKVSVLGAEGLALEMTEPFRTFAEQVIGCTGLPSWFLGMHWSATERLAGHQVKMLLSQLSALRRQIMPEIERLIATRQQLAGKSSAYRLTWQALNLQDALEQAQAAVTEESAVAAKIKNVAALWQMGFITQQQAADRLEMGLGRVKKSLSAPPPLPMLGAGQGQEPQGTTPAVPAPGG